MRGSTAAAADRAALDQLRVHWRRHVRQALSKPYLAALLAGSLLLSFASFFTTFTGMLHFMPVWLITFCIVFAVQALLFVTSWRLGFALAERESTPLFTGLVFLICLSTSVFFSWVALFETINDAETQERTRTARMHVAVADGLGTVRDRLDAARRTEMAALVGDPAFTAWTAAAAAVADDALAARARIETALKEEALSAAERVEALERERAAILGAKAETQQGLDAKSAALAAAEAETPALIERRDARLAALREADEAVVVQEGRMRAEETGGVAGGGAGRGPVWRELRDQRNILQADRDTAAALADRAAAAVAENAAQVAALRREIAAAEAGPGAARLAAIETAMSRVQTAEPGGSLGAADGVSGLAETLRQDLGAVAREMRLEPFDRAAALCQRLETTLASAGPAAGAAAAGRCDAATLAPRLAPVRAAAARVAAFSESCGAEGASGLGAMPFDAALAFGRGCIDRSGLPPEAVSDVRGELTRLVIEEDADTSAFVKTVNAFAAGDKLGYFALAIAVFIDLLVLFSGVIGALSGASSIAQHFDSTFGRRKAEGFLRALTLQLQPDPNDTPELRTTRAILRNVAPRPDGDDREAKQFPAQIDLDTLDGPALTELGAIRQFLANLRADDLARPRPSHPDTRFLIRANVLDALRHHLFEAQSQLAQERPAYAPAPVAIQAPSAYAPQPGRALSAAPRRGLGPESWAAGAGARLGARDAAASSLGGGPAASVGQAAARQATVGHDAVGHDAAPDWPGGADALGGYSDPRFEPEAFLDGYFAAIDAQIARAGAAPAPKRRGRRSQAA